MKTTLLYTSNTIQNLCYDSFIIIVLLQATGFSLHDILDHILEIISDGDSLSLGVETFEDLHFSLSVKSAEKWWERREEVSTYTLQESVSGPGLSPSSPSPCRSAGWSPPHRRWCSWSRTSPWPARSWCTLQYENLQWDSIERRLVHKTTNYEIQMDLVLWVTCPPHNLTLPLHVTMFVAKFDIPSFSVDMSGERNQSRDTPVAGGQLETDWWSASSTH